MTTMLNTIVTVVLFILIPLFVGVFVGLGFYRGLYKPHFGDISFCIFMGFVSASITIVICLMFGCFIGLPFTESDSLYNAEPQPFALNGVDFVFTDQRYIDVILPEGFYGRVSVLNTESRYGLFSIAIAKNEVFSKAINTPKTYRIDTSYTGSNQVTIEVENQDRYESHVFTLKSIDVVRVEDNIPRNVKKAVEVIA